MQHPVRKGGRNSHLGTLGKARLCRDIRFGSGDRHTSCTAHVAVGLSSPLATRCSIYLDSCRLSQNTARLNSSTPSPPSPGAPLKPSAACRLGAGQGHARGHACEGPKLFQRGLPAVGGPLGSAQATTVLHQDNSSISQSNVPSGPWTSAVSNTPAHNQAPSHSVSTSNTTCTVQGRCWATLRVRRVSMSLRCIMQGVGLLLSVQKLRGSMTWKCSGELVKARQINIDDKLFFFYC